jgi:hypothetical protein
VAPKLENCFPDGLVGQIASYIYKSYPRPVPEIALAGAIGLMSGICGRSYNVSGTGLNMYTLLLAKTGTGKDAMAQGISRIRQQISETVPAASDFVGPNMASGQALARHLAEKSPAFVSIFGEFGKQLERYSSKGASSADRALATLLLDLYSKSGAGVYMPGTVFADTAKNTADLLSPSFSILGESTPETYYAVADEAAIAEGLLPRFLVIEYEGPRVPKRDVAAADYLLHPVVRQQLADLCDGSLRMMARHEAIDVLLTPEAQVFLDEFDRQADNRINSSQQSVTRQLWNRAHLKALKLAALLAVGCHPFTPVITLEQAQWAQQIVEADVLRVISRFDSGNLGFDNSLANDSERRAAAVVKVLRGYPGFDVAAASNLNIKPGMIDDLVIPHSTLRRNVCATAAFRKIPGYKTPSHLFKEVIDQLIEDEVLAKVPASVLWMKYQHTGTAYQILG